MYVIFHFSSKQNMLETEIKVSIHQQLHNNYQPAIILLEKKAQN